MTLTKSENLGKSVTKETWAGRFIISISTTWFWSEYFLNKYLDQGSVSQRPPVQPTLFSSAPPLFLSIPPRLPPSVQPKFSADFPTAFRPPVIYSSTSQQSTGVVSPPLIHDQEDGEIHNESILSKSILALFSCENRFVDFLTVSHTTSTPDSPHF